MRLWFIHILPRPPPPDNRDLFPAALAAGSWLSGLKRGTYNPLRCASTAVGPNPTEPATMLALPYESGKREVRQPAWQAPESKAGASQEDKNHWLGVRYPKAVSAVK